MAKLLASVAPEANSKLWVFFKSVKVRMLSLDSSKIRKALRPNMWLEDEFPYVKRETALYLSNTALKGMVVAALSK